MTKFLPLLLFILILRNIHTLTGQELKDSCQCDLQTGFCDFNCCCDTDCSATIDTSCFYAHSSQFCIQTQYYFRVSPTLTAATTQNCYYYNTTEAVVEEVNISNAQVSDIISNKQYVPSLPDNIQAMYPGYTSGVSLGITAYIYDENGNCITNGGTTGLLHTFNFNQDIELSCLSTSNNINLYTQISGRSINKYYLDTTTNLTIPTIQSSSTQINLYFILGTYGSQKLYYIQEIRAIQKEVAGATTRTLRIKYIDPKLQTQQEVSQPSFFPQIPYDIFFPIQQYFFVNPF